jgi:hypothetical protein
VLGEEKAEYHVTAPSAEDGRYGFAYTGNAPYDFSAGTIGLNLRGESNQAECWVQTFAAVNGTNHRSFWTLDEIDATTVGINSIKAKAPKQIFDLQGRRLNNTVHSGMYIVNGKKVIK